MNTIKSLKRRKNPSRLFFYPNFIFQMMLLKCILLSFVPWIIVGDDGIDDIQKFQKLFMSKRIEQLTAVKNILKLDESKRKVLLDQITSKLFQVNQNSSKLIHRNNHTFTFFF